MATNTMNTMGKHTGKPVIKTNKAERETLDWVGRGACGWTFKGRYATHFDSLLSKGLIKYGDRFGELETTDAGADVLIAAGLSYVPD